MSALEDVSLEFEAGEFAALVGRSGCGKSTLLNLAGAMDFPTSGTVTLDGVVTSRLGEAGLTRLRRKKVGFIFQSFQLLPTLSVIENVELPLMLDGQAEARAESRWRLAGSRWMVTVVACRTSSPAARCSGSPSPARWFTRRAFCWRTSRPAISIPPPGNESSTLLRDIAREKNTTILMATHSVEAAGIADTLIRLRDGHVTGSGWRPAKAGRS